MLKRILVVTAIILAAAVFLSGCDALTFNSAENLVRPPKLAGADGESAWRGSGDRPRSGRL